MTNTLDYIIRSQVELNLSFMPFIKDCGLFIPTTKKFHIGETIILNLQLPDQNAPRAVEAEVIWTTPKNALYQIYQGIGVQFKGEQSKALCEQVKANLDDTMDVGGYTYGLGPETSPPSKKTETKTKK